MCIRSCLPPSPREIPLCDVRYRYHAPLACFAALSGTTLRVCIVPSSRSSRAAGQHGNRRSVMAGWDCARAWRVRVRCVAERNGMGWDGNTEEMDGSRTRNRDVRLCHVYMSCESLLLFLNSSDNTRARENMLLLRWLRRMFFSPPQPATTPPKPKIKMTLKAK